MVGHYLWEALLIVMVPVGLIGGVSLIVYAWAPGRRRRDRALGGGVVLVLGLVACSVVALKFFGTALTRLGDPPSTYVGLSNDIHAPVAVYLASAGGESLQLILWPDESEFLNHSILDRETRCTTADLVFRDAFEAELGRLPPPVCATRMVSLSQCVQADVRPSPPCALPTPRPRPIPTPSPTPEPTRPPPPTPPPGGISEQDAIRIAQTQVTPTSGQFFSASWGQLGDLVFPEVAPEVPRDRLVWAVWMDTAVQPDCSSGASCLPTIPDPVVVILDFKSGDFIATDELF